MTENPSFHFQQSAVCYHFSTYTVFKPENNDSCDAFWSFERDLLKDEFREHTPFFSRCVNNEPWDIRIHFPERVEFVSEGQTRVFECAETDRVRPVKAFLRYTCFRGSGIRVWHLILQTPKGGHFTEFDLIKLVSIYAGLQEKTSSVLREQICFSCGESKPQDLSALLMAIGGNEVPPDSKIMGGTVQVITKDDRHSSIDWQELNVQMNELHNGDNKITAYENLRSQYEKKEEYKLILNTLAGIILGIFHFDRYFFTELADTFTPLVEMRDEFIRLINKTLTILVPKEIPDELFFRIGITPYMLIPHAVMIHNTMQINHVLQHLCQLLNAEKYNIRELEKAREDAERRLNRDFVPSVFRYRTEKDILANAFRETGAAEKFTLAQNMLTETIERIYAVKRRHERRFMLGIGLASTFFAGFGFHPVVDQFFPEVLGAKNGTWEWVALALFLGLSLVALFVLLLTGTKAERRQGET